MSQKYYIGLQIACLPHPTAAMKSLFLWRKRNVIYLAIWHCHLLLAKTRLQILLLVICDWSLCRDGMWMWKGEGFFRGKVVSSRSRSGYEITTSITSCARVSAWIIISFSSMITPSHVVRIIYNLSELVNTSILCEIENQNIPLDHQ